jgi:hypothetical protein
MTKMLTIHVTQEVFDEARYKVWWCCEIIALAIARSVPGARDVVVADARGSSGPFGGEDQPVEPITVEFTLGAERHEYQLKLRDLCKVDKARHSHRACRLQAMESPPQAGPKYRRRQRDQRYR